MKYLSQTIAEAKFTPRPRYGIAADGYTVRSGAPTRYMIRLENEKRWWRVMCWQFSNASTLFIRTKTGELIVDELDIPAIA